MTRLWERWFWLSLLAMPIVVAMVWFAPAIVGVVFWLVGLVKVALGQ
jgi:hypothetical protein